MRPWLDVRLRPGGTLILMGGLTCRACIACGLLLVGALSLGCQVPPAGTGATAPPNQPSELPGFRPDAWFLPDDPLLGFVEIPAGPFLMGSDPAVDRLAFDNERWSASETRRTVELPTFLIGRFEVTVAQFRAFIAATRYPVSDPAALNGAPDHPVASVSWPEALAYGRWLETTLGAWAETPPALAERLRDGWRVTLPSEAEWEKAARGPDGRVFPWGDLPRSDRANYQGAGTTSVGSFPCPECPFGLSDMSGNVWELTRSPYQPYPWDAADEPVDLGADAIWVMRGGHFGDLDQNVRAAIRGGTDPGARRPFIGFRVVISRF